jgi:hypothetical protein
MLHNYPHTIFIFKKTNQGKKKIKPSFFSLFILYLFFFCFILKRKRIWKSNKKKKSSLKYTALYSLYLND